MKNATIEMIQKLAWACERQRHVELSQHVQNAVEFAKGLGEDGAEFVALFERPGAVILSGTPSKDGPIDFEDSNTILAATTMVSPGERGLSIQVQYSGDVETFRCQGLMDGWGLWESAKGKLLEKLDRSRPYVVDIYVSQSPQ